MACNADCPCHKAGHVVLSVAERLQIEHNHFHPETGALIETPVPSAAQGDVHWLDWHEHDSR
jgi:hypothetical protein